VLEDGRGCNQAANILDVHADDAASSPFSTLRSHRVIPLGAAANTGSRPCFRAKRTRDLRPKDGSVFPFVPNASV